MDSQRLVPRERSIIARAESKTKMLAICTGFKHIAAETTPDLVIDWRTELLRSWTGILIKFYCGQENSIILKASYANKQYMSVC